MFCEPRKTSKLGHDQKKFTAPPHLPHWEFQIGLEILLFLLPGGIVGPTFACIISGQVSLTFGMGKAWVNSISFQFKALMDGDRFFYRHTAGPEIRCFALVSNVSKDPSYYQATYWGYVGPDKTAAIV